MNWIYITDNQLQPVCIKYFKRKLYNSQMVWRTEQLECRLVQFSVHSCK